MVLWERVAGRGPKSYRLLGETTHKLRDGVQKNPHKWNQKLQRCPRKGHAMDGAHEAIICRGGGGPLARGEVVSSWGVVFLQRCVSRGLTRKIWRLYGPKSARGVGGKRFGAGGANKGGSR